MTIIKALADPSRLMILNALIDAPHYVEELAERMELAVSTVSFHLKKLEKAKLVCKAKDQYYVMYWANPEHLDLPIKKLITIDALGKERQQERLLRYRAKVIGTFFNQGRLVQLPVQKKKRHIVLEEIAALFDPERIYPEKQVDGIIGEKHADYVTVRRELVDGGFLERNHHIYRLCDTNITARSLPHQSTAKPTTKAKPMNTRAALKRAYKQNPPPAGIYKITNAVNGKIFIGKGMNIKGKVNSLQTQLKWGGHRNPELQQDWNQFGPEHFTFEVVDYLEPSTNPDLDLNQELAALEQLWLDKLEPYGDKGYNR